MTAPLRLDEIDVLLLDLLQQDAAAPLHVLGEQVGLSPSAVQRRIVRYRADGLLVRQVAVLDPERLAPTVLATVLVTLARESDPLHRDFADRMLAEPAVQQCYAVAGPWDYVVMITASSMKDCGELGNRLFKNDENVRRYETLLVFNTVKAGLAVPVRRD